MFLSGNVEALMIGFISVCAALILYDLFTAFRIRRRDVGIRKIADDIDAVACDLRNPRRLKSEKRLMAVEMCLDRLSENDPALYLQYKSAAEKAFSELIRRGKGISDVLMAYIVFLSAKYGLFYHTADDKVKTELLFLAGSENPYLRENALQCIDSVGDEELKQKVLLRLDSFGTKHRKYAAPSEAAK